MIVVSNGIKRLRVWDTTEDFLAVLMGASMP